MNNTEIARELCFQAMASPFGIVIQTDNLDSAKSFISMARKGDKALASLVIKRNPDPGVTNELWLVRTKSDRALANG